MKLRIGPLPAWVFLILALALGSLSVWISVQALLVGLTALGLSAVLAANLGQHRRLRLWIGLCVFCGALSIAMAISDLSSRAACLASYEGKPRVIGTQLRPESQAYRQRNPGLSNDELLFDAAGVPERVWTRDSISRCALRLQILPAGLPGAIVSFVICALTALALRRQALLSLAGPRTPTAPSVSPPPPVVYDCFISYRHQEPDRTLALELVQRIEEAGFKVALDERDFAANQHFLAEMERCIKQSRFTLCLVSQAYLRSGNCEEEAVITKVLDMSERKRRLAPLFLEEAEMPVWLYGLVGVNFYRPDPAVDPFEKLLALLRSG
ncbi:MAG: toll/interleukin-1 receptor domain-containing protein [Bryobacterales bacterium]|nr:toll/interleukin-1 receptor domain-containing protein [Bryobacterales bacterium]